MAKNIPWVTQYASPSLIADITYGEHRRTDDPRWPETGAPDLDSYAAWSVRWCGMACLQMILLRRDGSTPTLYELAMASMAYGSYSDDDGAPHGLIYRPFAEYVRAEHDLDAEVITNLDSERLLHELGHGGLVIASVHPEIRRPHLEPPGTGGHLVLVTGYDSATDALTVHNPAGHTPETVVATLSPAAFDRFAAHRGIVFHNVV